MSQSADVVSAEQLAINVARCAALRNCEDVVILDLRKLSPVTDFFVLCTGTSDRQIRAVADDIDEHAEDLGHKRLGWAGREVAQWILLDYFDVVVHIFDAERRSYYDLEMLWGDAQRVDWSPDGTETP